ncbi:hypothetical protein ADM96_37290 [Burkholderia sp. ST111]|nr:hypothetical protein ADM96_37290 [Burkholderia sp. ST111]
MLRKLRESGHDVWIITPASTTADQVPADFVEHWHGGPKRFTMPQSGTLLGHAEILRQYGGFFDEGNLLALLHNWRALLTHLRANVILADFAPAAMLAAKTLGIPRVVFETGFFYPPDDAPFPVLNPDIPNAASRLRAIEADVTRIVNACLRALHVQPLARFASLFAADEVFLVNHPALDCFRRATDRLFVGPIFGHPKRKPSTSLQSIGPIQDGERPVRVFVYLSPHFAALSDVLDVLAANSSLSTIAYIPGDGMSKRWAHCKNLSLRIYAVDLDMLLPHIDVVICHGGVGTINRALSHGIPLVLLPMFREQQMNAERIRELGLGTYRERPLDAQLASAVETLARDPDMRRRAIDFAKTYEPSDLRALVTRVERCVPVPASKRSSPDTALPPSPTRMLEFSDLDVIFISMDEPNADRNWQALLAVAPHARRVHGVKGLDNAHREAGRLASTERFVTVDADTVVNRDFFMTRVAYPISSMHSTWCWASVNAINGLAYGNGGVKIWSRCHLDSLISHENAAAESGMSYDFCFHAGYSQYSRAFAMTFPNGSPYQAFRAGFREAVKLGHDSHGTPIPVELLAKGAHHVVCRRLIVWMSIGADVENGLWAVLGARMGFMRSRDAGFDPSTISNFDWFPTVWQETGSLIEEGTHQAVPATNAAIEEKISSLGDVIRDRYGLAVLREWNAERSSAFKHAMRVRRPRRGVFDTEQDI